MSIIGKQTKSRGLWGAVNPVTKIKESKKNYDRNKHKKTTLKRIKDYV